MTLHLRRGDADGAFMFRGLRADHHRSAVASRRDPARRDRGDACRGLRGPADGVLRDDLPATAWGSLAVFVVAARRNGARGAPWVLIGAGFACFAVGDLLFALDEHVLHTDPFPSDADVAYLAGYPLLACGLAALVRRTRPNGDRIALIDAGIFVVPVAVTTWIYLVDPYATDSGLSAIEKTVSAAYPLGDLLCVAVLLRLAGAAAQRRAQEPALSTLVAGFVALLIADVLYLVAQLEDSYVSGGWSDAIYVIPYVALAAAAASPSVEAIGHPRPIRDVAIGRGRLALLAASALVTPMILIVQSVDGGGLTVPLVVLGTVVTFVLVVARMAGLVHALEQSRARLEFDATHDLLTRLVNRSLFTRRLDEALASARPGGVLFIDLDGFKRVNDTLGHRAGDDVLADVARRLRGCVRDDDVVGRLAGDEFVVLIAPADETAVYMVAGRILRRLELAVSDDLTVTASIGVVTWSAHGVPARGPAGGAEAVLAAADRAMYKAKDGAGNQLVIQPAP